MVPHGAVLEGERGSGLVQDQVRGRGALPAVAVGSLDGAAAAIAFWRCALGAAVPLPSAQDVRSPCFPRGMLYPHLYVRQPRERFWTDQDGFRLRDRGCSRRARLGPLFPLRRSRRYAWLGPRRNSTVQDAPCPRVVLVPGDTGGPQSTPFAPRPRGALPVAAASRQCPGSDDGRRHGGARAVSDYRPAGDVARRACARLRRGGGPQDRLLRKRGPHGDPAISQRARGLPREGQGSSATGTDLRGRGDPATTHASGSRPLDGQLRPARGLARDGGRAGRGAPWPYRSLGHREAPWGTSRAMSLWHGGQVTAALVLDAVFGEPPEAVHPTVWMGRAISAFEKGALGLGSPRSRRLAGILLALSVPSLVFVSARMILGAVPRRPGWMIGTALISTTLSMRGLAEAAGGVERRLHEGLLEEARTRVGRFVGRDTGH